MSKHEQWQRRYDQICETYGKEPENFREVAEAIRATIDAQGFNVVGLHWELTYKESLGNTHSHPMDGVMNWGQDDDRPKSYPGLYGRVWIRYGETPLRFGSDPFQTTMSYTGTGGGGSYDGPWERIAKAWYEMRHEKRRTAPHIYSWDYKIWVDDWPCIKKEIERHIIMANLKNEALPRITHKYAWDSEETQLKDRDFLEQYQTFIANKGLFTV